MDERNTETQAEAEIEPEVVDLELPAEAAEQVVGGALVSSELILIGSGGLNHNETVVRGG